MEHRAFHLSLMNSKYLGIISRMLNSQSRRIFRLVLTWTRQSKKFYLSRISRKIGVGSSLRYPRVSKGVQVLGVLVKLYGPRLRALNSY